MFNKAEHKAIVKIIGNKWASLEIKAYAIIYAKISNPLPWPQRSELKALVSKMDKNRAIYGQILTKLGIELPRINYDSFVAPSKINNPARFEGKPEYKSNKAADERHRIVGLMINQL